MAKKSTRKAAAPANGGRVCAFCGEKSCNCLKISAGFKVLVALSVLGFASGVLAINTAAWIAGLLVLIEGLMMYKSTMA